MKRAFLTHSASQVFLFSSGFAHQKPVLSFATDLSVPAAGCLACVGAISVSQCQAAMHNTSCFISAPTLPTRLGKKPPMISAGAMGGMTGCSLAHQPARHPVPSVTRCQARDRALGAVCYVRSAKALLLCPAAGTGIVLTWRVPLN